MPDALVVHTDGYCQPNPGGLATWAFVVERGTARVAHGSGVAGDPGTNDLGEWRAAFEALDWLERHANAGERVTIRNDNARVVKALANEAPVPHEGEERRLAQECRRLWNALYTRDVLVAFSRVPRWENAVADRLASDAHRAATLARAPPTPEPGAPSADAFELPKSRRGNR